MLAKRYRLRHSAELSDVRQHGQSWRHPLVILVIKQYTTHDGAEVPVSRFAFVVSRRLGNAVVRNRAKRLLREAVRLQVEAVQPGWDCVWIGRVGLERATFAQVTTAVTQLLSRSHLFHFDQDAPIP